MRPIIYMFRISNLLIIALTFLMLRYLVFIPVYSAHSIALGMGNMEFILMVILTILIAATGYISNDYYDVITDSINKPGKQYIGKQITAGTALSIALLLSLVTIAGSAWLSWLQQSFLPAALLLLALAVAWWYAIRLKRTFVWGNTAVACMSAGTIVMAWLLESHSIPLPSEISGTITRIVSGISTFAFLLSMLREIMKDIEDIEGDKLINCKTLPIVTGIPLTKAILQLILIITFILLVIAQVFLFHYQRYIAIAWLLMCVELPLFYFAFMLQKSQTKADYHKLSTLLKFIMLGGILTLVTGRF